MRMTASKEAKEIGLKGLQEMADLVGVPRGTLNKWYTSRPKLFRVLLLTAIIIKHGDTAIELLQKFKDMK